MTVVHGARRPAELVACGRPARYALVLAQIARTDPGSPRCVEHAARVRRQAAALFTDGTLLLRSLPSAQTPMFCAAYRTAS